MKKLEMWRRRQNMMLTEVAELSGISAERIGELEETKNPTGIEALCLGWALKIDPEEITGYKDGFGFSPQRPAYSFQQGDHQNFGGYLGVRLTGRTDMYWLAVTHGVAGRVLAAFDDQHEGFSVFPSLTNDWIAIRMTAIADIRIVDGDNPDADEIGDKYRAVVNQVRMAPSLFHALIETNNGDGHDDPQYRRLVDLVRTDCNEAGLTTIDETVHIYDVRGTPFAFEVDQANVRRGALALCAGRDVIPFDNFDAMISRRFRANDLAMVSMPLSRLKQAVDPENVLYQAV